MSAPACQDILILEEGYAADKGLMQFWFVARLLPIHLKP
jgi:hypothetical protein